MTVTSELKEIVGSLMKIKSTGFHSFDTDKKNKTHPIGLVECHGDLDLRKAAVKHSLQTPKAFATGTLFKQADMNRPLFSSIFLKRIAHAFSIKGELKTSQGSFSLVGFNETFIIPMLIHRFTQFAFENNLHPKFCNWMQKCFLRIIWHKNAPTEKLDALYDAIQKEARTPFILSSGNKWHSNQIIFFGRHLIICDRGKSADNAPGLRIYKIVDKSKITKEFIKKLVDRMSVKVKDDIVSAIFRQDNPYELFGLEFCAYIRMGALKEGICTYGNFKAALFTLMMLWPIKNVAFDTSFKAAALRAKPLYKRFVQFDRTRLLREMKKIPKKI